MPFITKLNHQDNRQHKLPQGTNQQLSGFTTFGIPFSATTTGPDPSNSGITGTLINVISIFSGNTGTTVFTFGDADMALAESTFSAITPSNSATTQETGNVWTGHTPIIIDGNQSYLGYSGVSYDFNVTAMTEVSAGVYTGSGISVDVFFLSADTLDTLDRLIYVNNPYGITKTKDLIITDGAVDGYVWTASGTSGEGHWAPASGGTSGGTDTFTSASTLFGSTLYFDRTDTLSAFTADLSSLLDDTNFYTTASTVFGTTAYFDRTDSLSAYTLDLSSLSGGSGDVSYWSADSGTNAVVIKNSNVDATDTFALAWGTGTTASGKYSTAYGRRTTASGDYSHAEGYQGIASGEASHVEGFGGTASNFRSHAEGFTTTASGSNSHSEGSQTVASGASSHAEGQITYAGGQRAHSEGNRTKALGDSSHSGGKGDSTFFVIANGESAFNHSFASTMDSNTTGDYSAILGGTDHTITISDNAAIIGGDTGQIFKKNSAILGGINNTVFGESAIIAGGSGNTATANYSTVLGGFANNTGDWGTVAYGSGNTINSGSYSMVGGADNTITAGLNALVIGGFNNSLTTSQNSSIIGGDDNVLSSTGNVLGMMATAFSSISGTSSYGAIIGGFDHIISAGTKSLILGGDNNTIGGSAAVIIGGAGNDIYGSGVIAGTGSGTIDSTSSGGIIASNGSELIGGASIAFLAAASSSTISGSSNSAIIAGNANTIASNANYNTIIASSASTINSAATRTAIIGGVAITGNVSDMVYVPDLTIDGLVSVSDLQTDANGKLIDGASDRNLKQNIVSLTGAADKIKGMRGVSFEFTPESNMGGGQRFGFIAQEIQDIIPEMVRQRAKGDGMLTLNYTEMIPWLVEAVKEILNGETTIDNTILKTQTIVAEDNNIELNYNGNHETALGGGISVKNGIREDADSFIKIDETGRWIIGPALSTSQLTLPEYTPDSAEDSIGCSGDVVWDDRYLYIKTNYGWRRTGLEIF